MSEIAEPAAGRWIAVGSGLVTGGLVLSVIGTYVYGSSLDDRFRVSMWAELDAPPADVVALLHDVERRPEWRPKVVRIGRKSDPADVREVWREMDVGDDRFDFEVIERRADGLTLQTAAPEQIGYEATWRFSVLPDGDGSRLRLVQEARIDNPLFRGVFWLRGGPDAAVVDELEWLAISLDGRSATVHAEEL